MARERLSVECSVLEAALLWGRVPQSLLKVAWAEDLTKKGMDLSLPVEVDVDLDTGVVRLYQWRNRIELEEYDVSSGFGTSGCYDTGLPGLRRS